MLIQLHLIAITPIFSAANIPAGTYSGVPRLVRQGGPEGGWMGKGFANSSNNRRAQEMKTIDWPQASFVIEIL